MLNTAKLTETIPEFQARLTGEQAEKPVLPTIHVVNVSRDITPEESAAGLFRSVRDYQTELQETAAGLAAATGLPYEECRSMAYLIVHESIPEQKTRNALEAITKPQTLQLGGTAMRMLDGGLRAPTSYGHGGEANPEPALPLEYWLEERYNND